MKTKLTKININSKANQNLEVMTKKINDGFFAGHITKTDLASWILDYFFEHAIDSQIEKIRRDHFDQVAYLTSILKNLKQAKKEGTALPQLSDLLNPIQNTYRTSQRKKERQDNIQNPSDSSTATELKI